MIRQSSTVGDRLRACVEWRLCIGCGACAALHEGVRLHDFEEEGIRPVLDGATVQGKYSGCPVLEPARETRKTDARTREWGPVLEVWEGHASDSELRFRGSSGGVLTALAAYCIESGGMHGVLHVAQDEEEPIRNRTRLSTTRGELLGAVGSRYSPGSVCNGLGLVSAAPAPCVVVGRPAEIAGVRRAAELMEGLAERIGVTLSFFCAESPATAGTRALLRKLGEEPSELTDLRYRGRGWPGHFAPTMKGVSEPASLMTYSESWAFLQSYRPWSTHLWPDGTGEMADIACGDPWYETPDGSNPGSSLVLVRTERGREILRGAIESGCVDLRPAEFWKLERSQQNLLNKKGAVWGRILAMRLCGLPVPKHDMAALFHCWKKLPASEKLRSTVGTMRRILQKKLRRPLVLERASAAPVKEPLCGDATALQKGS